MTQIRLISWNVNGIRAVHRKGAFDWFQKIRPEIFCIQETKSHPAQLPAELTHIDGYHSYFSSAVRKGYSGVALYSQIEPMEVKYGFGNEKFDMEGRILIAEYPQFYLFNIYYPNGKSSPERLAYKMEFYDTFLEVTENLKKTTKPLIICGDVNTAHKEIDLARPKENEKVSGFLPEERAWIDKFLEHGYLDTFRMFNHEPGNYTWWDYKTGARERNIGWRIDYFFVSQHFKSQVKNAWIDADVMGSDHCPLGIEINL